MSNVLKPSKHREARQDKVIDKAFRGRLLALIGDKTPRRDRLIEYLHRIQDHNNGIDAEHLAGLADIVGLSQVEVYETASFYSHFRLLGDGESADDITLRVCDSLSCKLAGAEPLLEALGALAGVRVVTAPCMGRCDQAPVAMLGRQAISRASVERVASALEQKDFSEAAPAGYTGYDAYVAAGGYTLLRDCFNAQWSRDEIINRLQQSGLRGLGGAGFPAANKWRIVRDQPAKRMLVVNIDEGEPGTFKDRFYLQQDPHRLLEGALIAAFVIEAGDLYLYLRDEYPGIHRMLSDEIATLQARSGLKLPHIHLRRGAGAYVCGEESALIESLEGKRGMPRLRPPYIAHSGLFGRPTLEHNMETLYWVRDILEKGADWFVSGGRRGRSGMRSFSLSGRVKKPGVYRAAAGISVQELIDEYGGGMQDGHELYGYFPGGASGGMLPASLADVALDFDTLNEYGCFIGSAAIIVFSQADSVRELALNAMRFFADESCGQCTPCRVGTTRAVQLMQQAVWDRALLHELAQTMMDASICGLGQAAPNPMLCAMKYFPQEFS